MRSNNSLEPLNSGRLLSDSDLYAKVEEKNEQIAHRRIVANGKLRNHGRNNNSPQLNGRTKFSLGTECAP